MAKKVLATLGSVGTTELVLEPTAKPSVQETPEVPHADHKKHAEGVVKRTHGPALTVIVDENYDHHQQQNHGHRSTAFVQS